MQVPIMLFLIYGGNMKFFTKLKGIEIQKRYVVLVVVLAVIIRFWGENSITMLQKDVPLITSTEISLEEVTHYIQTKQQFLNDNISISQDILVSKDLENYLDRETHEWFLLRGWRPKRFFYVEERLKQILSFLNEREIKLDEAQRLEEQAKQFMIIGVADDNSSESMTAAELQKQAQDIRYYLNRELRHAGITQAEENIVINNLTILEPLLEK